jgi:hypothetical protein
MRRSRRVWLILALGILAAAAWLGLLGVPALEAMRREAQERGRLRGVWAAGSDKLVVTGDELVVSCPATGWPLGTRLRYRFAAGGPPRRLRVLDPADPTGTRPLVYEADGDRLRIAIGGMGEDFPALGQALAVPLDLQRVAP